ncbi:MAG: zinc-ribbon domain-containing protein [Promethearchaeota archaeon]
MPNGYCPKCKKIVMATREDFDAALAIFLFCCTGGIGLIIYLIVYYSQPENKCVFCGTQIQPYTNQPLINQPSYNVNQIQPQNISYQTSPTATASSSTAYDGKKELESPLMAEPNIGIDKNSGISTENQKKFCPMCGAAIRPGAKFCQTCGSDLQNI